MTNQLKCPQCGQDVPQDAPQGLCPKCLIGNVLQSSVTSTTSVASTTPPSIKAAGTQPPSPHELAKKFRQLEIVELLGQGGMGIVYKARQISLDRTVALKILPPDVKDAPTFSERFAREARSLAKLSHPNIVAVYDFGHTDGLYYFIMEYVDGTDLRKVQTRQRVKPRQALRVVADICAGLHLAHDQGIVHRDIKPENVLVNKSGRLKIADFGLAKLLHTVTDNESLTSHGALGTPNYMAPEQWHSPATVDQRADIYSVGVLFYELLTGSLPAAELVPPSAFAKVDKRVDDIVRRALEADPEKRYQQASDLRKEVIAIMNDSGNEARSSMSSSTVPPSNANKEWHYARYRRQCGPFHLSELKQLAGQGEFGPEDLVWRVGWGDKWRPAREVEELIEVCSFNTPPRLPRQPPPVPHEEESPLLTSETGQASRAPAMTPKSPEIQDRVVAAFRQYLQYGTNSIHRQRVVYCIDLDSDNAQLFHGSVAHYFRQRSDEIPLIAWSNHRTLAYFTDSWNRSVLLTTKRIYGFGCTKRSLRMLGEFGIKNAPYAFEYASLPASISLKGWPADTFRFGSDIDIDTGCLSRDGKEWIRNFLEQACALWRAKLSL